MKTPETWIILKMEDEDEKDDEASTDADMKRLSKASVRTSTAT